MLAAAAGTPLMVKAAWPLRTMTEDEARAYVAEIRAGRRSHPRTSQSRLVRLMRRLHTR